MVEFILVLFVHAGVMSKGDSMAITNIPGFISAADCEAAGKAAKKLTEGTVKSTEYTCIAQKHRM